MENLLPKVSQRLWYEYPEVLDSYGLKYIKKGYYFEVEEPSWTQGWIIDISAIITEIEALLNAILPYLAKEMLPFKIAIPEKSRLLLGGEMGSTLLGKFISIFPPPEKSALEIANQLIFMTKGFKGPEILTDRQLGGIVYARYGGVKPIIPMEKKTTEEGYIYDSRGNLIKDPFNIPFILPEGVEWPFSSIVSPKTPKKETVLQDRYKPMEVLKADTKGSVKKGLYLEKWWKIRWCVIKEGRKCMIGDSRGRDVTDRLKWQFELQKDLYGKVPVPKVYDLFEENEDFYIVMEYIKGEPLQEKIVNVLDDKLWSSISLSSRLGIINYVEQILDIIEKMHEYGYIHRDITPANFLVTGDEKIWLIDLELSYSTHREKPHPPFRLGTPGFISPEQQETITPTIQEDIYAIGALLLCMLTGLMPKMFALNDISELERQIQFFIPDPKIINLITACLNEDPEIRPSMTILKKTISEFKQKQLRQGPVENPLQPFKTVDKDGIRTIINWALDGLSKPPLLSNDQLWESRVIQEHGTPYEKNGVFYISPNFHHGLSGVIWLLARASRLGFSTESCKIPIENSLEYIHQAYCNTSNEIPTSLYFGASGAAIALGECIKAGLIPDHFEAIDKIKVYLDNKNVSDLTIINGLAGEGLALLQLKSVLDDAFLLPLIHQKLEIILESQQPDGSWVYKHGKNGKLIKLTGLGNGVAGVICFLLNYAKLYPNKKNVSNPINQALDWLCNQAFKKRNRTRWPLSNMNHSASTNFEDGCAGIILCLIKAYEILGNPIYQTLAEDCLFSFHSNPISADITQSVGLSGHGEVYLEAYKVFKTDTWKIRGDNIAQFILHHFCKAKDDSCYWYPDGSNFATAGLMGGNSGIIHFLLRYSNPNHLNHPLLAM